MKMYCLIIGLIIGFVGCKQDDGVAPIIIPGNGTFKEFAVLNTNTTDPFDAISFQAGFFDNNNIVVGTSDGIWRLNLITNTWDSLGFSGKKLTALYKHPVLNTYLASIKTGYSKTLPAIYTSINQGKTWTAASGIYSTLDSYYFSFSHFRAHPTLNQVIFSNISGNQFVVSKDGGLTWNLQNYSKSVGFGYDLISNFYPDQPNKIYFGTENPLDVSWLGRFDININDPVLLTNLTQIIKPNTVWGNRRPNSLEYFSYVPNSFYVGQEGALAKVTDTNSTYIFNVGITGKDSFPYSYIRGIWVDPKNTKHILFGGFTQAPTTELNLFETYDEGKTIVQIKNGFGLQHPRLLQIIATNDYPVLVLEESFVPIGQMAKIKIVKYIPSN
ncbi:MAG: hypothetical protein QM539_00250 [Alphaproteobacteria bacterium]|nr:hypothetical protein [Alphaproteobacteria bacterium]